ncbi:MAG: glycosyltransferase [Candidatus Limnocylindrales bacterium]
MRVLLTTHPGYGHFRPLLPLAHALVAAGHEVRIGTSASFAGAVEREGLTAEAIGLDWLHGMESTIPAELRPPPQANTIATYFAHKFVRMTAGRLAADVVALAGRWRPDLIVRETTEYGGSLAAQVLGLPSAALQVASPTLMSDEVLAEVAVALDELRPGLGLAPDPGLAALNDELVICFASPALHDPTVRLPAGLRSFHPGAAPIDGPPPDVIAGLGVERPLVYATLGTVFNDPEYQLPFFASIRDGLSDAPVDLLMTVGPYVDPAALGEVRSGVRVLAYVPQRAVLDRCSVVVCHGGYGTLLDAVDAGVPLVVVPFGADQPVNAAAIQRLGIGIVVEEESMTPQTIREAVDSLLDVRSPHRQRLQALREAWRALPGPAQAVEAVVALAARAPEIEGTVASHL